MNRKGSSYLKRNFFSSSINYVNKKPLKLIYNKYNENITTNPPLIILHGLMGCKANWHTISIKLAKNLNPNRSIYVPDARNHGQSPNDSDISYDAMSEDLKQFIENDIKRSPVALLGHSMGGLTNILFALKWPQMVEKLIIIDVNPIIPSEEPRLLTQIMKVLKLMQSYSITKNEKSLTKERQKLYIFLKRDIPSKRTRQFLLKNLIKRNGNITWQLNIPALLNNSDELKNFPNLIGQKTYTGPTSIICGLNSNIVKESDYSEIKKLLPNVEFHLIKDAGHWVHYEKPDEFIRIVAEKLNK